MYSCARTFIITFLYYFTFKENTRWHDASSQHRDMTAHKRMYNPDRLNHTDNSNSYSITPHTVSSSHIFPLTDRWSPLLSPPTLPPAIKVNQLGLPSTTNTCMFSEWRLEEAHEVLAWKVLNRKLGGRKARGKKKLIGNQQTLTPPLYQRIFHKHIRDESPTCMMFSPPTSPSIFPAYCPGQSKRCTSKVSSQWRGFSFFISNRRALLSPHTKCNAVGPSFISLRGEKPEQGTTESGFRIQVWKRAAVVWMRVYVPLCFKWALSVTQSRAWILGQP